MRKFLITSLAAAASLGIASPASAATTLVADGITYMLTLNSVTNSGTTGNFTLSISGINTASDTEGGRTGINAFAFNDPSVGTVTGGSSTGFTFLTGGLNSSGCNSTGNFFCFSNSSYVFAPVGGALSINFSVTDNTAGAWSSSNFNLPDFKIDWTGSKNNYDLVSLGIPVDGPLPEPATWAMMLVGFGGIGMAVRRRRQRNPALMQIA